jgi:hypothetical protein
MKLSTPVSKVKTSYMCVVLVTGHALAAAGALDSTFGNRGVVQLSFGSDNTFSFSDAALVANGDIVISGTISEPCVGLSQRSPDSCPTAARR